MVKVFRRTVSLEICWVYRRQGGVHFGRLTRPPRLAILSVVNLTSLQVADELRFATMAVANFHPGGLVQWQQQAIIEFQNEQIKALLERQVKKRIKLTDDQRRRLADKGKALGRKALSGINTIATPDTILCWHRELMAAKWDYSQERQRKPGRPPIIPPNRKSWD